MWRRFGPIIESGQEPVLWRDPYWGPDTPSYVTEWRFDFEDGSRVTVSFNDAGAHSDEGGVLVGTAPVAGQGYVFV